MKKELLVCMTKDSSITSVGAHSKDNKSVQMLSRNVGTKVQVWHTYSLQIYKKKHMKVTSLYDNRNEGIL